MLGDGELGKLGKLGELGELGKLGELGELGKLGEKRRSDKTSFVGAGFTANVSFSP
jgi:hypothetical protein